MERLILRELHHELNARFTELNGMEIVGDYGDALAEHAALRESAGVLDLSFRGRICLTGADRVRFLHGQVTNDVKRLRAGEGCYAALTTAKGKMESDLNIFCLQDELLLDFEPGLTAKVSLRLEKFLVSDDVQIVDAAPHYGLLSAQGLDFMFTSHSPGNYGAGWFVETSPRLKIYHEGGDPGFAAFEARYPDQHVVIIVLSNEDDSPVRDIADAMAKHLFGD
jgi:hypothetical protein